MPWKTSLNSGSQPGRALFARAPQAAVAGAFAYVDFNGEVVARCEHGSETVVSTTIYLDALRRRRQDPSWNFLSQLRTETFRAICDDAIYPANLFATRGPRSRHERESVTAIDEFNRKGVFAAPSPETTVTAR